MGVKIILLHSLFMCFDLDETIMNLEEWVTSKEKKWKEEIRVFFSKC
jgi:hypothetical protein